MLPMNRTHITPHLIYDWICLPLAPYHALYNKVNHTRLSKLALILSNEIYHVFQRLTVPLLHFMLRVAKDKQWQYYELGYYQHRTRPAEEEIYKLIHMSFFDQLMKTCEKPVIDIIQMILEDNFIIKDTESIKIWISSCFHEIIQIDINSNLATLPGLNKKMIMSA